MIVPGYYLGNADPTLGERLDFIKRFADEIISQF